MTAEPNAVRLRILRAVNQDGLLDATVGFSLLVVAAFIQLARIYPNGLAGIVPILPVLAVTGMRGLRARVTYPRIGYANPQTRGISLAAAILLLVLTLAGVGVFLLMELTSFRITPAHVRFLPLILGACVAAWALAMGIRTGFGRFYPYAGLLAVALAACHGLGLRTSLLFVIPMGSAGVLMLVSGIVTLVRFIRANPPQSRAVADDA